MHRKMEPFRQQSLHHQAHLVPGGVAGGFGLDVDLVRIDPFRQVGKHRLVRTFPGERIRKPVSVVESKFGRVPA
jgi:hypothetical protein